MFNRKYTSMYSALAARKQSLDAVIRLEADTEAVVARLRKRAIEQGRVDDSEEAIRHRQDVFRRQTAPLVEVYRQRGLLVNVDGLGQMDDVTERIIELLEQRGIVPPAADVQPAVAAG